MSEEEKILLLSIIVVELIFVFWCVVFKILA